MPPQATVVGAGIAGLAAGHALVRLGYEVRVVEREKGLRTEGAGLTLWPNAVAALRQLDLGSVLMRSTHVVGEARTLTPAGATLSTVPLDRIGRDFGPLVSAHRADLLEALARHLQAPIEFGTEVRAVDGVLGCEGRPLDDELVIGADGIGSEVREAIAPGTQPRAAGYGAWRGVAATGAATPNGASETMGRGKRFGLVPLPGERTYWFAVLADGDGEDDLRAEFGEWHDPIPEVLAATPPAARSYLPLHDLPPLPRWHRGGSVLVGDAAHAMTPNLGQGAAQALQDVAVLVGELGAGTLDAALGSYEARRKRHCEMVVRRSHAMGRIAQARSPLAVAVRNGLARVTPARLTARQLARLMR